MENLLTLPGVARKPPMSFWEQPLELHPVVSIRTYFGSTGLTKGKTPEKVEIDLMKSIPPDEWINFSHQLIHHGRKVCAARKPACERCVLIKVCPRIGVMKAKA
jgi:endonuclease-3